MTLLSSYRADTVICDGCDTTLFRAKAESTPDSASVIVKAPASQRPSPSVIRQLEHEYELARELTRSLVLNPISLVRDAGTVYLLPEDCDCLALADNSGTPMEPGLFLRLA